jgi:hypothetical protein
MNSTLWRYVQQLISKKTYSCVGSFMKKNLCLRTRNIPVTQMSVQKKSSEFRKLKIISILIFTLLNG